MRKSVEQRKKRRGNAKIIGKYTIIAIIIFLVSLIAASLSSILLSCIRFSDEQSSIVADMISGILAAVAAALVLVQLRQGAVERKRQNDIEEASFILQYNQNFIQDENMTEIESLLENNAFYDLESPIMNPGNRQKFINYLVYLEGLAPTILNGVLNLDHVDDLMAYRFFLAMNNPEIQKNEIGPFAEYYRGCFELYEIWSKYRRMNHLGIPLAESSLDKLEAYRYMLINTATATFNGKQLSSKDSLTEEQYIELSRLIYETDPYIYPAMFDGDKVASEAAEALLPALIEQGTDCMMNKENLFVMMADNVIVGMILWHKGNMNWDGEAFLRFAEKYNIKLNHDSVMAVAEEYVETRYSATKADLAPVSLINVCVSKYMRGKGIGNLLLEKFIAEHKKEDMELVVLSDNASAIALYKKHGFKITSSYDGFSLTAEKPRCYAMYRCFESDGKVKSAIS